MFPKKVYAVIPCLIAVLQWLIMLLIHIDRLFFVYDNTTIYMVITKVLLLLFLAAAWQFVFRLVKRIREKDAKYLRALFVVKLYFVFVILCIIVLWPGTWSWDDLRTLNHIYEYTEWDVWQNVITGMYQDVVLQIFPFPAGIIIVQNIIISICIAYVIVELECIFPDFRIKNKRIDIVVKLLPFVLPPVVFYQFSGYRIGLYIYLELVFLVMLVSLYKQNERITNTKIVLLVFLSVVVSIWRTESFVYIFLACLLVCLIKDEIISRKKKVLIVAVILISFVGMSKCQNYLLKNDNYKVVSLVCPAAELVRNTDAEDQNLVDMVNRVLKVDVIYENPNRTGIDLYWNVGILRADYSKEDYRNLVKAVVILSCRHPLVMIRERCLVFAKSIGVYEQDLTLDLNIGCAAEMFRHNDNNRFAIATLEKQWILNKPILEKIRRHMILLIGMKDFHGDDIGVLQRILWNAFLPILVLIGALIRLAKKKDWVLLGVLSVVLIRIPIVFLTEPDSWMMYVLSFYLLGYVCLVVLLLKKICWLQKKDRLIIE